jgi:hypothetical protein
MAMHGVVSFPLRTDRVCHGLKPADFPHEHARSRTFRWGEDGIAGVCDTHGLQNIAFAFWNEEESVSLRGCVRTNMLTSTAIF